MASSYRVYRKYQLDAASRNRLNQFAGNIRSNLAEELQTAGLGISLKGAVSSTLVVDLTTTTSFKVRPAVFLSDDRKSLTMLTTAQEGVGELLLPSIVNTPLTSMVLTGTDYSKWAPLQTNSLVLAVLQADVVPGLYKLTNTPRKATAADVVGMIDPAAVLNFDRTVYLEVTPAFTTTLGIGCYPIAANYNFPGARVLPIEHVLKYSSDERGLIHKESITDGPTTEPSPNPETLMTPYMNSTIDFSYITADGQLYSSGVIGGYDNNVRGVRVHLTITDPTTRISKEESFDAYVTAWNQN